MYVCTGSFYYCQYRSNITPIPTYRDMKNTGYALNT